MAHDPQCYELARHFLDDQAGADEADMSALAEEIQRAVEQWIEEAGFVD